MVYRETDVEMQWSILWQCTQSQMLNNWGNQCLLIIVLCLWKHADAISHLYMLSFNTMTHYDAVSDHRSCLIFTHVSSASTVLQVLKSIVSIPRTKLNLGKHAFSVAPSFWNELTTIIRNIWASIFIPLKSQDMSFGKCISILNCLRFHFLMMALTCLCLLATRLIILAWCAFGPGPSVM